jgi:hypothetical protein
VQPTEDHVNALTRRVVDLQAEVVKLASGIHAEVEKAFAAKYEAKFRELDDLRNQCARALPLIVKAGLLTQAEINEALRDE